MSILIDLKPTMLHPSVENGWIQLKLSFRDWETVLTQFSTHLLVFSWYWEQWRKIGWKWKIWNIWSIMDNLVGNGKFDQNWWPCWVLWPWVEHINLKDCLKNLKTCFTKLQSSVFFLIICRFGELKPTCFVKFCLHARIGVSRSFSFVTFSITLNVVGNCTNLSQIVHID